MSVFYEFDEVDAFTTGTVGRPGQRTFFLQVRAEGEQVEVKCEKQQASAVVQYLRKVLSDLPPADDRPLPGSFELVQPVDAAFVLGPIGLGYDRSGDRILVQLEEVGEVDEEGNRIDDGGGHVRLSLTRGQATAFCDHAEQVIEAGRPDCQWCGHPIDPDGHACPRMN
jgi:uncharacterized repeat protein (TIGR03847 family)